MPAWGGDPVTEYMRLAAIPPEGASEVEQFLRRKESGADTLAVLERPDQPIALLQIHAGEATLFTFPPKADAPPSTRPTSARSTTQPSRRSTRSMISSTLLRRNPHEWKSQAHALPE